MAMPRARGSFVEQPVRQDLAVEDVAPGEAEAGFKVRGAENEAILDEIGQARCVSFQCADDQVADLVATGLPASLGQPIRRVLSEYRKGVFALRCQLRLGSGLDPRLDEHVLGGSPLAGGPRRVL